MGLVNRARAGLWHDDATWLHGCCYRYFSDDFRNCLRLGFFDFFDDRRNDFNRRRHDFNRRRRWRRDGRLDDDDRCGSCRYCSRLGDNRCHWRFAGDGRCCGRRNGWNYDIWSLTRQRNNSARRWSWHDGRCWFGRG